MTVLLVLGLSVATWRTTRLLIRDEFPPVRALREWVIATWGIVDKDGHIVGGRRLGGIGYTLAYLWTCPWCMSIYVAAAVVGVADWRLSVPLPWLVGVLGAGLTGMMAWLEDAHDQRDELRRLQIERES